MYTNDVKERIIKIAQDVTNHNVLPHFGRYLIASHLASAIKDHFGTPLLLEPIIHALNTKDIRPINVSGVYESLDGLDVAQYILNQLPSEHPMVKETQSLIAYALTDYIQTIESIRV